MEFEFKGQSYTLPSFLNDITLGQRIEFYNTYGKSLDEALKQIQAMPDGLDKDCEMQLWYMTMAIQTFSFYSTIPLDEVESQIPVADVMNFFAANLQVLHEQEQAIILQPSYTFEGEEWVIEAPELTSDSKMVFNEFLHAKEIVRQMAAVGSGNWAPLPFLCSIYFRKKGEAFDEELVRSGSERMKLMEKLPLDIALAVGFFLTDTMSIYLTTSQFSKEENEVKDQTQPSILIDGDG